MDRKSPFDLKNQHNNTDYKVTMLISKLSDFFRQSLWSKAQPLGISPIQVQILLFIKYHNLRWNKVSHLAKEFQMTKATISDSVRVLLKKQLLEKVTVEEDKRSFYLKLTSLAEKITEEAEGFTDNLESALSQLGSSKKGKLFEGLYGLLDQMNELGLIPVQRMCFGCSFYEGDKVSRHGCSFLKKKLNTDEIRVDCEEYNAA